MQYLLQFSWELFAMIFVNNLRPFKALVAAVVPLSTKQPYFILAFGKFKKLIFNLQKNRKAIFYYLRIVYQQQLYLRKI